MHLLTHTCRFTMVFWELHAFINMLSKYGVNMILVFLQKDTKQCCGSTRPVSYGTLESQFQFQTSTITNCHLPARQANE